MAQGQSSDSLEHPGDDRPSDGTAAAPCGGHGGAQKGLLRGLGLLLVLSKCGSQVGLHLFHRLCTNDSFKMIVKLFYI